MPKKLKQHQLFVEGKNDRHVIWDLCHQYQLPETFSVDIFEEGGTEGIEIILPGLPGIVREPN